MNVPVPHPDRPAGHRTRRAPVGCPPTPRRAAALGVAALLVVAGCTDTSADGAASPPASSAPTDPPTGTTAPGTATTGTPSPGATSGAAPAPAPDEHTAVGALPDGFPTDLLPLPDDAEILVATYAPEGEPGPGVPHAVSLNARTAAAVPDVLGLYRASLTAAGFTESVGTPAAGTLAAESTFSRSGGEELLVVGVLDRDDVRTVTVGGRVRAPG